MNKKLKTIFLSVVSLVFWLVIWWIVSYFVNKEILLPSPFRVISRLIELMGDMEFYTNVFSSLLRITVGYVIGIVVGSLFALFAFYSKVVNILLTPLFTVIKATPVASFIILALVWIGKEKIPTFTAFLMVLPIVYGSVSIGLASTDKMLAEVASVYQFGFWRSLTMLYIPSALPSFITGLKTSLGLSWKAGIAAEVLCSLKNSIGGKVYTSKLYLESVDLMAWTLTVIVLSLILECGISHSLSAVSKKYSVSEVSDNGFEY